MVSHWSLRDSKSPQVSWTLHSILANISYYHYYLLLWEFLTPVLTDGFSLEFERQQVSSSLLDSSQYSGQHQLLSLLFTPLRVSHTSVNRWFLTGVWETASLLKSPGLFTVFWPSSVIIIIIYSFESFSHQR